MISPIEDDFTDKGYEHDPLTAKIIGCCYEVHRELGPGFPEKVYANALQYVLKREQINYIAEKEFVVSFGDYPVGRFRCDLFIEGRVIVELKSVTGYTPKLFHNQLLSYLKASKVKTGLLINFGNVSCEVKRLSV